MFNLGYHTCQSKQLEMFFGTLFTMTQKLWTSLKVLKEQLVKCPWTLWLSLGQQFIEIPLFSPLFSSSSSPFPSPPPPFFFFNLFFVMLCSTLGCTSHLPALPLLHADYTVLSLRPTLCSVPIRLLSLLATEVRAVIRSYHRASLSSSLNCCLFWGRGASLHESFIKPFSMFCSIANVNR